jgi:uncharacterized protein YcsI (UPF0317 family)
MATTARATLDAETPAEIRRVIAAGEWAGHTGGLAPGYTQANLVILPKEYAYDFLLFCVRNPKPCPLLDVTDPGSPVPEFAAPGADLRVDLPRYRVYEHGQFVAEPTDLMQRWRDDWVAFLLGCSYTFEHALLKGGVRLRHVEEGRNVSMFRTARTCTPAGRFHGPLVVSMRPICADQVASAVEISARFRRTHGAPVHIGDPASLGIADLTRPDWGESLPLEDGEVPVFWACGVTPQAVALAAQVPLMITHSPGHMFVTDIPTEQLES